MFWQVRLEASEHGLAMVCYKYRAHLDDPVVADGRPHEATGMWADPSIGQPEWSILGAGSAFGLYHRFGNATARGVGGFVVYRQTTGCSKAPASPMATCSGPPMVSSAMKRSAVP